MKLLLIENDQPSLKALAATLKMLGFENEAFSDPVAALARFKSANDFDLVITDLRMPGKNGTEILREIRELDSVIPMVVVTAFRDHGQINADRVFYKPVDIQALVQYLHLFKGRESSQKATDVKGKLKADQ